MNTKGYLIVSTTIFTIVGVAHFLRITQGWHAQVGTMSVPIWASWLCFLLAALVASWGMALIRRS